MSLGASLGGRSAGKFGPEPEVFHVQCAACVVGFLRDVETGVPSSGAESGRNALGLRMGEWLAASLRPPA